MSDKQDEIIKLLQGIHAILPTLATKADLAEQGAQLRVEMAAMAAQLRAEMAAMAAQLRAEMAAMAVQLRVEMAAMAAQSHVDTEEMRADLAAVQSGLEELRRVTSTNHYKAIGRIEQVDVRLDRVIQQITH
ncbi:MAG: hypothetical protein WCF85_12045 [Rhodospirillaceae bacterium]